MILLDTHVLVWWVGDTGDLPPRVATRIDDDLPALASPISFWELAVLVERGRIELDRDIARWVRDVLASDVVDIAPLSAWAAIDAARLPDFHGDPADRFIYGTARELGAPLVSKDRRIRDYARKHRDVHVVW